MDFQTLWEMPDNVPQDIHVTLQSTRRAQMYEPGAWAARVSPTPILMVVGTADSMTPTDIQLAAYDQMLEPKSLQLFEGSHFDAYTSGFEVSSSAAADFFAAHLKP